HPGLDRRSHLVLREHAGAGQSGGTAARRGNGHGDGVDRCVDDRSRFGVEIDPSVDVDTGVHDVGVHLDRSGVVGFRYLFPRPAFVIRQSQVDVAIGPGVAVQLVRIGQGVVVVLVHLDDVVGLQRLHVDHALPVGAAVSGRLEVDVGGARADVLEYLPFQAAVDVVVQVDPVAGDNGVDGAFLALVLVAGVVDGLGGVVVGLVEGDEVVGDRDADGAAEGIAAGRRAHRHRRRLDHSVDGRAVDRVDVEI